jgi:uncharacterized protein (DUF1697 family)
MEELRRRLLSLGLTDVATVKASGNVVFEAPMQAPAAIAGRIEEALRELTGGEVRVFLRSRAELEEIVADGPFAQRPPKGDTPYVTFLLEPPSSFARTPFRSPMGEVTVVRVRRREVYSLCRRVGNRVGFPNAYVEKLTGGPATTRGWPTVTEIAEAYPIQPG